MWGVETMDRPKQNNRIRKISAVSMMHYMKLVGRSVLFLGATAMYVVKKYVDDGVKYLENSKRLPWLLAFIWTAYAIEMLLRLLPSRIESPGCQKQFKRNYLPTGEKTPKLQSWKRTLAVVAAWLGLNGVIGALFFLGIIDKGILVLISLAYGVCDMICILFFCPFQTWFMKNRCCTDCRIYNWDFAMMFTPYVFTPNVYTWSILGLAVILLIRWEVTLRLHPERFASNTNACISCGHCTEKLCQHKKQLQRFIARNRARLAESQIIESAKDVIKRL